MRALFSASWASFGSPIWSGIPIGREIGLWLILIGATKMKVLD